LENISDQKASSIKNKSLNLLNNFYNLKIYFSESEPKNSYKFFPRPRSENNF